MSARRIELHIEALVLEGFCAGDRYRVAEALQRELSRLLADGELPARLNRNGAIALLDSGSFDVSPATHPEKVGTLAARRVYEGLRR
jgi:hypothetical protein